MLYEVITEDEEGLAQEHGHDEGVECIHPAQFEEDDELGNHDHLEGDDHGGEHAGEPEALEGETHPGESIGHQGGG